MSDLAVNQRWIRKNKNVKVRICYTTKDDTVFFEYIGNNHMRSMGLDQFLNEFVDLKELLDEITEGSKWVNRHHDYTVFITEVRSRSGTVYYRYQDEPKHYCYGNNIGNFRDIFKPELREARG